MLCLFQLTSASSLPVPASPLRYPPQTVLQALELDLTVSHPWAVAPAGRPSSGFLTGDSLLMFHISSQLVLLQAFPGLLPSLLWVPMIPYQSPLCPSRQIPPRVQRPLLISVCVCPTCPEQGLVQGGCSITLLCLLKGALGSLWAERCLPSLPHWRPDFQCDCIWRQALLGGN